MSDGTWPWGGGGGGGGGGGPAHGQGHGAVAARRVGGALGQHRSTQRKTPRGKYDDDLLMADIVALAQQYGRYGYRKITALLRDAGWAELA